MKPKSYLNLFSSVVSASLFGSVITMGTANAALLTWDGNGATAPNPNGGTGAWEAGTTSTWWNGSENVTWPAAGGTDDDAVFGNTAGTVSIAAGGVTANDLTFDTSGYIIQGGALTLNGANPVIATASGVSATLNSAVAGSGIIKTGVGTLVLGGANPSLTGITVSQGVLSIPNGAALSAAATLTLGDAGTGSENPSLLFGVGSTTSFGQLVVANAGTGQPTITVTNTNNNNYTFGGITLDRPLKIEKTAANGVWGQFQIASGGKITGNGGGAGNDTLLIYAKNANAQFYLTSLAGAVANDFSGNVHLFTGNLRVQHGGTQNLIIPDTSSVTIDSGALFTLNTSAMQETIDGLNGAGGVAVNGSATLTLGGGNGNGSFSGSHNANVAIIKQGTGAQEFAGSGITYTAATTLNEGILKLTKTSGWGSNIAVGAAGSPVLQLNSALDGDTWTFSKQVNGGSSAAKIEKTGPGTVVLNPAAGSSFVGGSADALTVTEGSLYVNAPLATLPAVSVASGARVGGKSTVGTVTASDGAAIEGGQAGTGTLTVGDLVFNGTGTLACMPSADAAPIVVSGTLTTSGGTGSVVMAPLVIPAVDGTYHLLQFGNLAGAPADFRFAHPTRTATLQVNGNFLDLVVSSNPSLGFPVWTGAGSGEWSHASALGNWTLSGTGTATDFYQFDDVFFDDSVGAGSTQLDVSVHDISPGVVTFNNSSVDYTLGGTKDITSGRLVKMGSGKLTITGAYSFVGGATLSGGTVSVAGETALGTGGIAFEGGALEYTGSTATWSRSISMNEPGVMIGISNAATNLTFASGIAGNGSLAKGGDGTLLVNQANSYSGGTAVSQGGVRFSNPGGAGSGSIVLGDFNTGSSAVSCLFSGGGSPANNLVVSGQGEGTATIGTYGGTFSVLSGTVTLDRATTITDATSDRTTISGKISGNPGTITISGYRVTFGNIANDFTGNLSITSGSIYQNDQPTALPPGTSVTVNGTGIFRFAGGGSHAIDALNGSGSTNIIVGGATTLSLGNAGSTGSYSGAMTNGAGTLSINKSGAGTQTLAGAGIGYTGSTSVTGGILVLENTTAFVSPTVTVGEGAVLAPTGTTTLAGVASLAVQAGGVIDPDLMAVNTGTYTSAVTQTLTGGGSVDGNLLVRGTVQPGDGIGSLAATGSITMAANSKVGFQIGGAWDSATSDSLVCDTYQINATGANPIVVSISGSGLTDFTESQKTFTLIHSINGGNGFTAGSVVIDAAAFNTATGAAGTWSAAQSGNDIVIVYTPPVDYAGWAASKSLVGPDAAPDADPDHDGIVNLLEFVTNGNPTVSSSSSLPTAATGGSSLVFTFIRRDDAAYLNPAVEFSTTLAGDSWTTAQDGVNCTIGTVGNGNGTATVTVTIPKGSETKLFARLKVTIP